MMSPSSRTEQWIELATGLPRAEFVRRYPGFFLVCSQPAADPPEVRWIRRRAATVTTDAPISVGRSPRCDIPLVHRSIADRHATLFVASDGRPIAVTDLGSKNGTRLNGQPLVARSRAPLAQRDELQFGLVTATIVESERAYDVLAEMAKTQA
jgi:pSer/pThr/pTyr-binding forkhead associated (FHA) protein